MSKSLFYLTVLLGFISAATCMPSVGNSNTDIFLGTIPARNAETKEKFLHLVTRSTNWQEAWYYCRQAYNGVLVAIETAEEDQLIKDTLILNGVSNAWTSGIYENGWRWGEGGLMSYTNWGVGHPGSTTYAVYVYSSGLSTYHWRSTSKVTSLPSICQSN